MPRRYEHISKYENEIIELRNQGKVGKKYVKN